MFISIFRSFDLKKLHPHLRTNTIHLIGHWRWAQKVSPKSHSNVHIHPPINKLKHMKNHKKSSIFVISLIRLQKRPSSIPPIQYDSCLLSRKSTRGIEIHFLTSWFWADIPCRLINVAFLRYFGYSLLSIHLLVLFINIIVTRHSRILS